MLAGAPGIGKTRLANEILTRANESGRTIAWVQGTRAAGSIPFGAFAHLLPATLSGAGPVNLLRVAAESITERTVDRPLVLGVDDAHLLDAASAALVRHLTELQTCFVVVTVRSNEPAPDAILSLWKDGPLERIELQSLSEDQLGHLVTTALPPHVDAATLHQLWSASRGNVLYLRELVLGGLENGTLTQGGGVWRWRGPYVATPRLSELVAARLGDLAPAERAVLEIVAESEPLEKHFLDALTDAADRESLERRGLLQTISSARRRDVVVSHPLYAEAVRASTPPSLAESIWRRLADLMEATGARRRGDLLRLATWRLGAGELADSRLFVSAARRAITLQDFVLAERLAGAAVRSDGGFDAHLVLADAMLGLGRGEEASLLLAELQERAVSDEERSRAALRRSDVLYFLLGRRDEATAVLESAAEAASEEGWHDTVLAAAGRFRLFGGQAEEAVATVAELLARPHLDTEILVEISPVATWGQIVTGRTHAALEFCDRLELVDDEHSGGQYGAFAPDLLMHNRCAAAIVSGRFMNAERSAHDAYAQSTVSGAEASRGVLGFTYGWTARLVGRPRTAATVLQEAAILLGDVDFYRHHSACLGELAHCHALLGDVPAAEQALAEADSVSVPTFVMDYSFIELARAWTAHARGEFTEARRLASECAQRCGSYGQTALAAFAWHDVARLGGAALAAQPLTFIASGVDGDLVATFAAHAAALLADDAGELDRVAVAFEQMGAALYAAEASAASARLYRAIGRNGSAHAAAANAQRLADECQGARTPELVELDGSLPLTRREHEIATLAARGLTNRQIAELLVLSVRTVDNHLHSAFMKLGVTHRDELAAIVLPASGSRPQP